MQEEGDREAATVVSTPAVNASPTVLDKAPNSAGERIGVPPAPSQCPTAYNGTPSDNSTHVVNPTIAGPAHRPSGTRCG